MRSLQGKIDDVFTLAGLSGAPQMVEWQQQEEEDIYTQHTLFEKVVGKQDNLLDGLAGSSLTEALTELNFEIDSRQSPRDFTELLMRALAAATLCQYDQSPSFPFVASVPMKKE